MCEDALVAAAKQGQAEAFATLCQPYARRLIRNAHRITRNHEDAEDALQDAFLSAFIHIKNFDGRSSFSTWLTRIAINSALMTLRKKRSSRETSIGFGESDAKGLRWDVPDPSPNPEKACAQREKERLLREAIRDLRQIIRRKDFPFRVLHFQSAHGFSGTFVQNLETFLAAGEEITFSPLTQSNDDREQLSAF